MSSLFVIWCIPVYGQFGIEPRVSVSPSSAVATLGQTQPISYSTKIDRAPNGTSGNGSSCLIVSGPTYQWQPVGKANIIGSSTGADVSVDASGLTQTGSVTVATVTVTWTGSCGSTSVGAKATVSITPPTPTPTSTPTSTPTATPTPTPAPLTLTISPSSNNICAGGWEQSYNDGAGGYYYLSKETGNWVPHSVLPDPHIAVLTAQVGGGTGSYKGLSVQFNWTMPGGPNGNGLVESRSVAVDSKGVATLKIVSGDQLSRDADDKGNVLFDTPVAVSARCTQGSQSASQNVSLNVLAPSIKWKYKDDKGNYVPWNGDLWGIYGQPSSHTSVPLQAALTFNNSPVFGHRVSWSVDNVYDKAGAEVLSSDPSYPTYGQMSGPISTTTQGGTGTADFKFGYNFGQLVFDISDSSVFTLDTTVSASQDRVSASSRSSGHRIGKSNRYTTDPLAEYNWVQGKPQNFGGVPFDGTLDGGTGDNSYTYPAPSGEEDNELLGPTLGLARAIMVAKKESMSRSRMQIPSASATGKGDDGHDFDNYNQPGAWWFSQCVGNDAESSGTHLADVKVPFTKPDGSTGYHYYSGAFDIVLTQVPIFRRVPGVERNRQRGRRQAFGVFVKAMRDHGIVAWHRWAGEGQTTSENEMHCIDPATPFLKNVLGGAKGQIVSFTNRGTGGGYPSEPPTGNFAITDPQITAVKYRLRHKQKVAGAIADNTTP